MGKFAAAVSENGQTAAPDFGSFSKLNKRSRLRKYVVRAFAAAAVILAAGGVSGYFYWQSLKATPQYSLALIVDAARHDDEELIDDLVDTNALVDDFMPQITSKAVEMYGRGLSPEALTRAERIAEPIMPAVKDRARAELPKLIRRKTEKFEHVPFGAMVIGAERYLDIKPEGNFALISSKLPEHSFEVKMERSGDRWKIVGVRDDQLAAGIARSVGQELIAIASNGGINSSGQGLGVRNITDLLKQAELIFK